MASDLLKSDQPSRDLVRRASDRVKADLERICLRGPERELLRTKHLQPLLVCVCLGYLRHLRERGVGPALVLGHSLGEITALAAAGSISFEAAVDVAAERGELMEAATARTGGGMIAVISTEREKILQWLKETLPPERLALANDNAPGQLVLSGDLAALEQAAQFVSRERLGRCRRLPVAGAWHTPLLADARLRFESWLASVDFRAPRVPVLFNASGAIAGKPEEIRRLVARNIVEPVHWRSSMERLKQAKPSALFEIGPGRVLSGLARANGLDDRIPLYNVNSLRGAERTVQHSGL